MTGAAPTVGEALAQAAAALAAAGVDTPRLDASLLARHAWGLDRTQLLADRARPLSEAEAAAFAALVARRARREPTARLLGSREFWSLAFALSPATLEPRPDSETLVEAALEGVPDRQAPLRLLDLGTGTGCLLLALLSELPNAVGLGVDLSEAAARTARDNARRLGLGTRAGFAVGWWGEAAAGPFDLILANPPYVAEAERDALAPEVRLFDPPLALFGGADGLEAYRAIAGGVARLLAPEGRALFEVGAGQAGAVARLLDKAGLTISGCRRDLAGIERCLIGQKRVGNMPH